MPKNVAITRKLLHFTDRVWIKACRRTYREKAGFWISPGSQLAACWQGLRQFYNKEMVVSLKMLILRR